MSSTTVTHAKRTTTIKGIKVPAGFSVKAGFWPHASFDLVKRVKGSGWAVICNAHGTVTYADSGPKGDKLGSKVGRPTWCEGCAK